MVLCVWWYYGVLKEVKFDDVVVFIDWEIRIVIFWKDFGEFENGYGYLVW